MKLFKPRFWASKKNIFTLALYPTSLIYSCLVFIKKKIARSRKFKIPIVCIGNIYLGGTGKTPLAIYIAKELQKANLKPAIVKKYYKNHFDEHKLIRSNYKSLILDKSRFNAINEAIEKKFDYVILDDGFQDYSIGKNLNILCFNQKQLVGNGYVFPAGPLREKLNVVKDAQIVVINGKKDFNFEKKLYFFNKDIKIYYSQYKINNLEQFKNEKILALAGIGNPNNFFELLIESNLNVKRKISFPDHYMPDEKELFQIKEECKKNGYKIVTTEKDYYRFKHIKFVDFSFVKVDLVINNKEDLINKVVEISNENI